MSKHTYTPAELARAELRDLIVDIRCARRDGFLDYAAECEAQFRVLWPLRWERVP